MSQVNFQIFTVFLEGYLNMRHCPLLGEVKHGKVRAWSRSHRILESFSSHQKKKSFSSTAPAVHPSLPSSPTQPWWPPPKPELFAKCHIYYALFPFWKMYQLSNILNGNASVTNCYLLVPGDRAIINSNLPMPRPLQVLSPPRTLQLKSALPLYTHAYIPE